MKIQEYSYRFAKEILQHPNYVSIYDEIITISQNCPLPYYPGKSKKQKKLDIVQQMINTYFKLAFETMGWESEPLATPEYNEDALRSDFRKTFQNMGGEDVTVQIEVEMGNAASSYRNYFKFQLSYSYDLTNICVIILPSTQLSKRIDSGVASFEKTVREIPSAKLSVTVPTLVIGLDDTLEPLWNVRAITTDMKVIKGSNRSSYEEHTNIVQGYINSIKARLSKSIL